MPARGHGLVAGGFLFFGYHGGAVARAFLHGVGLLFEVMGFGFGVGPHLLGVGAGALGVGFGLGFHGVLAGTVGLALFLLFLAAAAQQQAGSEEVGEAVGHGEVSGVYGAA